MLLNVLAGDYRYRVVGSKVVSIIGFDLTGKTLGETRVAQTHVKEFRSALNCPVRATPAMRSFGRTSVY
jgi:hypothetical protein